MGDKKEDKVIKLSSRELDVMKILWKDDMPMGAANIAEIGKISINTVQAVLKVLLNRKYIKVADIVYSGTVLSRRYSPEITANYYIKTNLLDYSILNTTLTKFKALIETETDADTINQLEELLRKKKKELDIR